jgi:Uncharacterised nucleotidyltransferase
MPVGAPRRERPAPTAKVQVKERPDLMRRRDSRSSFWPSAQQTKLLRAALLDDDQAAEAWNELRRDLDFDHLADGSYQIMPLIAARLPVIGPNDSLAARINGMRRHSWYRNQLALDRLASVLRTLQHVGIETMTMKGAAIATRFYSHLALRPLPELDVMVRAGSASAALSALAAAGWAHGSRAPDVVLRRGAVRLEDGGGRGCWLHWQAPPELLLAGAPASSAADFWDGAVTLQIGDAPTRALNPTDELLQVCTAGATVDPGTYVQWVADAVMILRSAGAEVDWARLVDQARRRRDALLLYDTLAYLGEALDAPIPSQVLAQLDEVPVTRRDAFLHRAAGWRSGPLGGLPTTMALYARQSEGDGTIATVLGIPRFLRDAWELAHLWEVPFSVARKGLRRASLHRDTADSPR